MISGLRSDRKKKLTRPHLNKSARHDGTCLSPCYMGGIGKKITGGSQSDSLRPALITRLYLKNKQEVIEVWLKW
jgi:hypothetical protein